MIGAPGIRFRIPLIVLLTFAVFLAVDHQIHARARRDDAVRVGLAHASGTAEMAAAELESREYAAPDARRRIVHEIQRASHDVGFTALVDDGDRIVVSDPDSLQGSTLGSLLGDFRNGAVTHREFSAAQAWQMADGRFLAEARVRQGPHRGLRFIWERDLSPRLVMAASETAAQTFQIAIAGLVLIALIALCLDRWLRVPAARLAGTADRIAAGDRTARADLRGSDELARAGQAFDRMAADVERTERELRASRGSFDTILQSLPVGVLVVNRHDWTAEFVNMRWKELFLADLHPGDDVRERLLRTRIVRADGSPYPFEDLATSQVLRTGRPAVARDLVLIREDGERVPHIASAAPVSLRGGPEFDAAIVVLQDRRELARLGEELEVWERRFEEVIEATGQLLFEWDLDTDVVRRSANFEKVFGYGVVDEPTARAEWRARLHPEDRERTLAEMDSAVRTGQPYDVEYRLRHGDGRWIFMRHRGFFHPGREGRPSRMFGSILDITAQKELEEHVRQAQRMETVGTLAGGIAHDFNNQLTGVIGHLELLGTGMAEDDPRLEHVGVARAAAERCAELTRGLLAFSRRLASHPRTAAVNPLVEESTQLLRRVLPATIALEAQLAPDLPPALVDAVQIQQVLFNLCLNARDAMPEGGPLVITTRVTDVTDCSGRPAAARTGRFVEIAVRDAGSGIAPDVLPRIFEPFYTTKPVGEGTGLGLAMVYGIVSNHGGWIEVESPPGGGSCFRVLLPAAALAPEGEPPRETSEARAGRGELVLVVDDESIVREVAVRALAGAGYRTRTAANAEEALLRFREAPAVDAVLLDVMMPGRGGLQVLSDLLAIDPRVRVVLTSGFSPNAATQDSGAAGFLQKPYTPDALVRAVHAAIAGAGVAPA